MQINEIMNTMQVVNTKDQLPDVALSSSDTIIRYVSVQPKWNALKIADVCDPIPLRTFGDLEEYGKPHQYINMLWLQAVKNIGGYGTPPTPTQVSILVNSSITKGWTVNMWRDFFFRCTTLEFATEFQNVQTHGLSYPFVSGWAKTYNDTIRTAALLQHNQQQAAQEREDNDRKTSVINEALNHVPQEKTPFQLYIMQCDALGKAESDIDTLKARYRAVTTFDYIYRDARPPIHKALLRDLLAWYPHSTAIICLKNLETLTQIQEAVRKAYGRVPEYFTNHAMELKLAYDLTNATTYTGYFRKLYEVDKTPVPLTTEEARSLTIKKMLLPNG